MSRSEPAPAPRDPRAEPAKKALCPCCRALLFLYRAEGEAETKCRKCKRIVKLKLSR